MTNEARCRQAAIKLLAQKAYSENELKKRLMSLGYNNEIAKEIIADLVRNKYLDDMAFCSHLFNKYLASGKYGINAIKALLRKKNFSEDLIRTMVSNYDDTLAYDQALVLINRRYRHNTAIDPAKAGRFLAARGFNAATVFKVLEKINNTDYE